MNFEDEADEDEDEDERFLSHGMRELPSATTLGA